MTKYLKSSFAKLQIFATVVTPCNTELSSTEFVETAFSPISKDFIKRVCKAQVAP